VRTRERVEKLLLVTEPEPRNPSPKPLIIEEVFAIDKYTTVTFQNTSNCLLLAVALKFNIRKAKLHIHSSELYDD
jgi:hypothetical protein